MAIILINLLIGPPLFRWSLVILGEAKPGPSMSSGGAGNVLSLGVASSSHLSGGSLGAASSGLQAHQTHAGLDKNVGESQQYLIHTPCGLTEKDAATHAITPVEAKQQQRLA